MIPTQARGFRMPLWQAMTLGLLLLLSPMAQAGISYQYKVTVDTSGKSNTSGYVDFQFNPATPGSTPSATAVVSQLSGYSSLGLADLTGDATGNPSSSLVLNNSGVLNASYSSIGFGSSLSFLLTLSGAAFSETALNGSTFLFALYDASQQPLNGSQNPAVVQIDLLPYGTSPGVETQIFVGPAFSGGADAQVAAVPEASTTVMLGLMAVAGLVAARRGRIPSA